MEQAVVNNDKELWRETEGDAYSPSIHVTEEGMIGISHGGMVYVKNVRRWHELAEKDMEEGLWGTSEDAKISTSNRLMSLAEVKPDPKWEYTQYLQILIEAQKAGHNCHDEINDTIQSLHKLIFQKSE